MNLSTMCEEIAAEFEKRGIVMRNTTTGREPKTAEDIFNADFHGELWHIYEWYIALFPERVDPVTGDIKP